MTIDEIVDSFKYLSGAYIDHPPNAADMEKQAIEKIGGAFKSRYQRDISPIVTYTFIRIWYGFYEGQYTLQCCITTPMGPLLSDPYLWPMGNGATITGELHSMGC